MCKSLDTVPLKESDKLRMSGKVKKKKVNIARDICKGGERAVEENRKM